MYKIAPSWYEKHYGGSFGKKSPGCGSVVENWVAVKAAHAQFVRDFPLGTANRDIVGPKGGGDFLILFFNVIFSFCRSNDPHGR